MHAALFLTILLPLVANAQLGGLVPIKLNETDPNVQFAVKSINSYYTNQGDTDTRTLVEIVSAKSQVVAGTIFHLELRLKSMNQEELCKVEVWQRAWLSGDKALQLTNDPVCKVSTVKSTTVMPVRTGGSVMVDEKDEDVQKALMFATNSINAQDNYMYFRKPVKIEEVKSQVVAGMAYHFRGVHMAATTCTKSSMTPTTDLKSCTLQDPKDIKMCNFDIWWQSWMTPEYKLTSFQCQ